MQAIQIKFLPATNTIGARLKATCEGGSIVEPINYSIDIKEQALELAYKLANQKLDWKVKQFSIGSFKNCYYCNIIG